MQISPEIDDNTLQQLMSMGFPEARCKKAIINTGNSGPDIAMNWIFEHMEDADIDVPFAAGSTGTGNPSDIAALCDMGFTEKQARYALKETVYKFN